MKLAQHVDFEICALTGSAPGRNDRTVRQKQPCRLAALAAGVFPSNHSLTSMDEQAAAALVAASSIVSGSSIVAPS